MNLLTIWEWMWVAIFFGLQIKNWGKTSKLQWLMRVGTIALLMLAPVMFQIANNPVFQASINAPVNPQTEPDICALRLLIHPTNTGNPMFQECYK